MAEGQGGELEAALGHRFRDPRLLARALTHRSRRYEAPAGDVGDNEQLEFLGDSVLTLAASQFLLRCFPDWSEGRLSKSRARLVSARALAAAARRLDLGRYLLLGRGEEMTGGREKAALLADAYEALVGAIFLDAGLEPAAAFAERTLLSPAAREQGVALARSDHKSALQEWLQARGRRPAEYVVVGESGPDHRKLFTVEVRLDGRAMATGAGPSKKEAELAAAEQALAALREAEPEQQAIAAGKGMPEA
jgi:ribonuclease-3